MVTQNEMNRGFRCDKKEVKGLMDVSFSGRRHLSCEFQLTQGVSCWPEKGNSGSVCEEGLVYGESSNDEEGDDSSCYLIL